MCTSENGRGIERQHTPP